DYEKKLLKGADRLSALIKCIEELHGGNLEFKTAYDAIYLSLVEMDLEEVNFFMENMLSSYGLSLDELAKI
ncbi:MAG: YfbR-like 5'-deoxynucleotidase, partial [Oscillospiraceae bacterium]